MSITKRTLAFAGTACLAGSLFVYSQADSLGQAPKSDRPPNPLTGTATVESEDLKIQIRKDNDKPARIEVKQNGKQWSVTEKEIGQLPAAIRQRVREVLKRSGQGENGTASPTTDPVTGRTDEDGNELVEDTAESEDLKIQIRKDNDKPARIEVKQNGKQWSVTEKEIDQLPAAIRQRVREVLKRSGQGENGTASPTTERATGRTDEDGNELVEDTAESEDLKIQIRKDNDKPARIEVKQNGKQWSVTEKEIDQLPAAIRQRVREVLKRSGQGENGTASPTTERAMKTTLGVHVSRVSHALRKQLKLPAGVGLLVEHVVDGSAAAAAGLQRYDVLHKFDDQLLINSDQLAVLVRIRQPGDKVTLTIIREGSVAVKEVVLTAVMVTVGSTGFDAFQHFHGYQGKQELQNCAACHVSSGNARDAPEQAFIGKSFDNYEFFHGTPGNSLLNNCATCHVKAVHPLKLE